MPTIVSQEWGTTPNGPVHLFTLSNNFGNQVLISNYGGIVVSILFDGQEMVVGYDELAGYQGEQPYYGALIGRYGNRIAKGKFSLVGQSYTLATNNDPNSLHGGLKGFDKKLWVPTTETKTDAVSLSLHLVSPDGEEGFPGTLNVRCTYTWNNENELCISYQATTDKTTIVNLTNHSYFNIGAKATVEDQLLELRASHYTPLDATQIPLGHLAPVANTPFDFRTPKPIGQDIRAEHPQIRFANGSDHH
ncbi:MAG: aldose epimerase family protein, partial [Bacteroidota bacterium]